jgi:hypothetical protein
MSVVFGCRYSPPTSAPHFFISINRFERKKCVELALYGFKTAVSSAAAVKAEAAGSLHLVIAGGYDVRVPENVEYYTELKRIAMREGLIGGNEEPVTSRDDLISHARQSPFPQVRIRFHALFF